MSSRERFGDLGNNRKHVSQLHRAAHHLAQRMTLNKLHGDEVKVVDDSDFIDGDEVGMIEGRECLRFTFKTTGALCVSDELRRKKFQGNATIEFRSPVQPQDRLQPVAVPAGADLFVSDLAEAFNGNVEKLNSRMFTYLDYAVIAER